MSHLSIRVTAVELGSTKTMQLTGDMSVHEVCKEIREKFGDGAGGSDHGLFWPETGKWMASAKVLDFYDLKSGDHLEFKKKHRVLKVKTLDDSVKQILVDESQPVTVIVKVVCDRIGLQNSEEYSFVRDGPLSPTDGVPESKKVTSPISPINKLLPLGKKLTMEEEARWLNPEITLREQGIGDADGVILKKKFFFTDQNIDRNDPIQLNLLYNQAKDMITSGKHPCTLEEAAQFAAIQCQVQFGNFEPDKHKPGFIKLKDFVPPEYRNSRDLPKRISVEHGKLQGLNELNAKFRYVQLSRSLKTYGITFFAVKEKHPKKNKLVDMLLGITKQSVVRLDIDSKDILKEWKLTQLRRWAANANSFTMDFGDYEDAYYTVQTSEGDQISQQIAGYIDIILKKKKEAEKVVHEEEEEQTTVEEYIKPGKAINVGTVSNLKSQAVESKVGTVMTANSTRAGYARATSQFQTAQLGSPVSYAQTAEISGAQQALLQSIRNGLAIVISSSADLEVGIQLPPIGNDSASQLWKQQTIDTNAESVSSQIASHLASAGSIINHATGNVEMMDYEILGSAVNVITSNLSHMSNGLKMLSALTEDGSDKESLLEAARNLAKATANYLEAMQPVIMGQASKDQMFSAARDVSVMASDLLTLIGRLDVSEDTQNELIDAARFVARSVAELVGCAKKVADTMKDQPEQLAVAADAKAVAEAANQLVACTTVVSPTITIQMCLDQLMESSVVIKDGLGMLLDSSSPCSNPRFLQALKESVQKVEEAIARLIEKAGQSGIPIETDPLDTDYQQVIVSVDSMLVNCETTEGIISSAKDLTLSATQFVNALKRTAVEKKDANEKDRLFTAAKSLADATSKMVAAAKDSARYPTDLERRGKLEKVIQDLQATATSACGPQLQFNVLQRLNKSLKDTITSQNQLILAARNAAASNRNQTSQIQLNQAVKRVNEMTPIVGAALKAHTASSSDIVAQCNLISAARQLLPAIEALVSAAKVAAPTAGEAASQSHILNLAKLAENDLDQLEKVSRLADEISAGLRLESALCTAEAIQEELQGNDIEFGRISIVAGVVSQEPLSVEAAHAQLVSTAKEIQLSIAAIASASIQRDEKTAGVAATEAISALQSMVHSAGALKGVGMEDDLKFSMQSAANGIASTLAALISAAKTSVQSDDPEFKKSNLATLASSANEAVGMIMLCLPGQRDLDLAIKQVESGAKSLNIESMGSGTVKMESYATAQTKLQASASALAMAANGLSSAVRGSLIELQNGANTFSSSFEKVIAATEKFGEACGDRTIGEKLISVTGTIADASKLLLSAAKASASDLSNLSIRNDLLTAARSVGDALNSLIDVCSASAPGHNDCNNALRTLVTAATRLDAVNEGTLASSTFSESVSKLNETGKQLCSLLNGVLAAARAGNVQKMAQDLLVASQAVIPLTESNVRAAYLIGTSDSTSVPAVPPVIDQSELANAGYDIKEASKKLIDPSNSQQQILEIAATIAKNTSNICNSCKVAGTNTNLSQNSRQMFISSAKDVAMKTSGVVAVIKQLAVGLDEGSRSKAETACGPLIEAIDKLVNFSTGPEFAGTPAKLSPSALQAQKPLIELNRAIVGSVQDVVNSAKLVCSNPKDQSTLQLMSSEAKAVTESVQSLISTVINSAPGQKECNDALQKITDNIGLIDAAIMDATVNNLAPAPGAHKDSLVETARAIASLIDVIARSATNDIGHLGTTVAELPGNFKQCVAWAIGVASNSPDITTQIGILNDAKHLSDCIQSFMLAVKQYTGNPTEAMAGTVAGERAIVRSAVNKLVSTIEGSRDDSGEFSKAVEKIEGLIATLEARVPVKASQSYQVSAGDLQSFGKTIVERVGDVITKAKTPEKFREYGGKICDLYESLLGVTCTAVAGTDDAKVKQGLFDAVRQLGGSTIRLIEAMRLASAKSAADHASRLKLGQAGREVSSNVSNLIIASKEGSRGIIICQETISNINDTVADIESTYIFAQAGNLDPIDSKDSFSRHKDNLLNATKTLTELVKGFISAVTGTQDQLANVATQSLKALDALKDTARLGAVSVTSGDKHMQQQLLGATKAVAESLQNLIAAAARCHGKPTNDPAMSEMGDAVKSEFSALAELVRVTKLLADESTRGTRAVEGAIFDIGEITTILESDQPAQGSALPDEVASLAKQLATTAATLVSSAGGKQDEIVAAANAVRKQVGDLARAGKAAIDKAPEEKRMEMIQAVKRAAMSIKGLLTRVKFVIESNSPANKSNLQTSAREVVVAINEVVTSAEVLIPGGYVDPNDPNVIAERELLNAAAAIEAASRKLASLRPPERVKEANQDLNFDEQIFEATKAIAAATAALVRSATAAQREIAAKGRVHGDANMYHSDGTWNEGLVSAAKQVAVATSDLCESANQAVKGNLQRERVIASAKAVSASTAQLLAAATAKADPNSQAQIRLRAAGKGVTNATNQLVKASEEALAFTETEQITAQVQSPGGTTTARILEMEAQVSILKMEKELEKARAKLAAVRKGRYDGAGRDAKGAI
ncbi:Talin-1 [Dinochytrium kinnereticum]|nr:Talin-1 [Dinochytrium kinnereticum]